MAITKVIMENLSDLDQKLILNRMLNFVFGRVGIQTRPAAQLANNFVRLVDRAILEHELAHAEFKLYVERRGLERFIRGQGHLETCIQSFHRSLNYVDALRGLGLRLADGTPLIPRAKDVEVLSTPVRNRIRDLRHAIEHTDERILKNRAPVGNPIALNPDDSSVCLEGISLTYEELARWLRQLHSLAVRINSYSDSSKEEDVEI
ncbi:MAG TPA: hypothetical protein VGB07_25865 [Blastocatellia bacterium]